MSRMGEHALPDCLGLGSIGHTRKDRHGISLVSKPESLRAGVEQVLLCRRLHGIRFCLEALRRGLIALLPKQPGSVRESFAKLQLSGPAHFRSVLIHIRRPVNVGPGFSRLGEKVALVQCAFHVGEKLNEWVMNGAEIFEVSKVPVVIRLSHNPESGITGNSH